MKPVRRIAAPVFVALAAASVTACFALFSLDEFGPPGAAADASVSPVADAETGSVVTPEASPPVDARVKKRVFITSASSNGNLRGLAGADSTCEQLAADAGLGGSFKAWLSVDRDTPRTRFFRGDGGLPDERLVDTTGRVVAESWSQLLSSKAPLVPIEHTERGVKLNAADAGVKSNEPGVGCGLGGAGGAVVAFLPVWTDTKSDGTLSSADESCERFETNNGGTRIGIVASDAGWTDFCNYPCALRARLYCFER